MKHNRCLLLIFISLISAATSAADEDRIKKMKDDRDKIAELKEEICKGANSSRSECFKNYLSTIQVQAAPELVLLSVETTDMYARDRMQWEEKEVQFRIAQIENWYASIDRVDVSKFNKAIDQQALTRAKQKLMVKVREELKVLYEILSSAKGPEVDEQKKKYRDLLQQYQKFNELKFAFPKT